MHNIWSFCDQTCGWDGCSQTMTTMTQDDDPTLWAIHDNIGSFGKWANNSTHYLAMSLWFLRFISGTNPKGPNYLPCIRKRQGLISSVCFYSGNFCLLARLRWAFVYRQDWGGPLSIGKIEVGLRLKGILVLFCLHFDIEIFKMRPHCEVNLDPTLHNYNFLFPIWSCLVLSSWPHLIRPHKYMEELGPIMREAQLSRGQIKWDPLYKVRLHSPSVFLPSHPSLSWTWVPPSRTCSSFFCNLLKTIHVFY